MSTPAGSGRTGAAELAAHYDRYDDDVRRRQRDEDRREAEDSARLEGQT